MSVLSDRDIIRELGKGILFHPLKPGSIKACDLSLTASEYAYSIGQGKRLDVEIEQNNNQPGEEQKFFYIPPRDTALIWTDESVWLRSDMCGLINSRVALVSKGIGHLGTRVNPCWCGVMCIAFHNVSDKEVRINVRNTKEAIAYLMIQKLGYKTYQKSNKDSNARLDIIDGLPNTNEIYGYFTNRENKWMTDDTTLLKELMLNSDEYKKLKPGIFDRLNNFIKTDTSGRWISLVIAIGGILSAIVAVLTYINRYLAPSQG